MNTQGQYSDPNNRPSKLQQRLQEELKIAFKTTVMPLLGKVLVGFIAASKEGTSQQAFQFKTQSDANFHGLYGKLDKMQESMHQLIEQIERNGRGLVNTSSVKGVGGCIEVCPLSHHAAPQPKNCVTKNGQKRNPRTPGGPTRKKLPRACKRNKRWVGV